MSLQASKQAPEYQLALQVTENIQSPAQGFVNPSGLTASVATSTTAIIKQNNTIIQLLITTLQEFEKVNTKIDRLFEKISKDQQNPSDLGNQIQSLQEKLQGLSLGAGSSDTSRSHNRDNYRVFTDPKKILAAELAKAKK